ncbi:ribosome-binding factor A [Geoalkalibacter ferrihydriticus]|uniref:Ribosome-binding factor A n=2 Tax=Geoalkalibacter ferrihydriticus TaxID=392333 RepID=A0A0C2DTL9_9BACT|nr:ribosome-binding factor A [Geoalkalibacter ferrihydriticus]KIH76799.1 ribosome-binding factor A [Geoalkalibacter ferrihydriticus DSM 17813]SDL50440.1 ribosome-binding factor A [Geoalkalibacter ferrihydriticus]
MEFQRSHRVGDQIHKEISVLLVKGLKDPRIGFVTITSVEVTPDLHLARVFFTVMGDEKARRESEAGLKSSTPFIRRELGKRLRMRYTPDLLFCYDTSVDYGNRIDKLLQDIQDEQQDDQGDSGKD